MRRRFFQWPAILRPLGLTFYALLSSKAIREKIGELTDRAQAIVDLADQEKRDLSAEEKAEIDGILGAGKKGEAAYKPGQIDALERDLERAEKLEARQAELAQNRTGGGSGDPAQFQASGRPQRPAGSDGDEPSRLARVRIPAAARFRYGRLKAYRGPQADAAAYLAGQFFAASLFRNAKSAEWCKQHGIDCTYHASLGEGSDPHGGFLVPVEIEQAIIDLRETYGAFRQYAQVVPMARDTKTQPVRKSGPTAYWVGEGDEITASDKAWGQVEHTARKLASMVRYSSELAEDAVITIGDDLTREFAYAFAVKEDEAGFNGDGTAAYGGQVGLKNALLAGSIFEAAAGNVNFPTLDMADFESCAGKMPQFPGANEAWYISKPGYWNSMRRLMDAAGGVTMAELADGQRVPMFLGYPVRFVNALPKALSSTTSTILAYFGDLAMAAQLGNRRGLSIAISDQRYFEFDQLAIRGIERVDVVVHSKGTATEAGAIIALKTPAA